MLQPFLVIFLAACASAGTYKDRFLILYNQITDGNNGYYSKEGVPYHSRENMLVETVDHGHETDSEALSYNIYLHAMYGAISKNFEPFNQAWNIIENYLIPQTQYNIESYNPKFPVYSADFSVGVDPLHDELKATYGEDKLFLMHWLLDTDDNFGFGNVQGQCTLGPKASGPSFVHMGAGSVWQGITYPACDNFAYGGSTGFSYTSNIPNWHYSVAPDADARVIQAAYWASQWATRNGQISTIQNTLAKVSKLGDYLRYSFYDVLYRTVGNCIGTSCRPAAYKESAHYLLSWFIGWGGNIDSQDAYSWRTGSSEIIIGYQNPVAAFAMVNDPNLRPKSPTGRIDWQNSLIRQVQLYQYLQTPEGALSGGVTNSWKNVYGEPPSDVRANTFYGMFYENEPLMDDGTSDWFGMWTWSMDRLAQYYYITGDATSRVVLRKWFDWIYRHVTITDTSYSVPVMISWNGSLPRNTKPTVTFSGATFYGIASSLSRALSYYAAKSGDSRAKQTAKQLLDVVWANHKDDKGLYVRTDLSPFINMEQPVFIPVQDWSGTYPNGDKINASSTFLDIRSWYKKDENWSQIENFLNGGPAPVVDYHRFWEQADMALALGAYSLLFGE
ncbi:unnamed protein product [Ceutorhynchus assimilis]|uniref:Uncharacterized protein n=1 Tax=Ceutorhynchus assimilis TaxID=467358 RepID=A0A9P0DI40_9CUCU|nr:unnamed protein product [Ceutorhynchus assimilis]